MASIRTKMKCANPATVPTSCKCTPNKETQAACGATYKAVWDGVATGAGTWKDAAAKCIKVTPDKQMDWAKHDFHYPANYANTCDQAGKEPGSYHCTWIKEQNHTFAPGVGYNPKWNSEAWCSDQFCWVDPCACDKLDISKSSWLDGYYSYSMCNATDKYTPATCDGTDKTKCVGIIGCKWIEGTSTSADASGVKIGIMSALVLLSLAK